MLVGPIPPPHGGMANQTLQLERLLRAEGAFAELVPMNPPHRPGWIQRVRVVRAIFRLVPYLVHLWRAAGRADVAHVMASSGWAWHLSAAPAVWISTFRRVPAIVNYRGGGAAEFLRRSIPWVRPTLARCAAIVVPSGFLGRVFAAHGFRTQVVPNVVDLERFTPAGDPAATPSTTPHLVVARNLEPIYDIATALRAFHLLRREIPGARISIAGSGMSRPALEALASQLGVEDAVTFTGRLENDQMAALYRRADLVLNPSLADNMPISVLESLACGVPVVTTDVGGIPDLVEDGVTAILVAPRDPEAMARAALSLLRDSGRRLGLVRAGLAHVRRFTWGEVRPRLLATYRGSIRRTAIQNPA